MLSKICRYAGNGEIKQRLLQQLAHCGIISIFTKVYASTHSVECLKSQQQRSTLGGTGNSDGFHGSGSGNQQEEDLYAEVRLRDATTAMQNLVSAATCLWHVCERSTSVCSDVAGRGVVSFMIKDLSDPRLSTAELLKDTSKVAHFNNYVLFIWHLSHSFTFKFKVLFHTL